METQDVKIPRFRKKPITVEAVKIAQETLPLLLGWGEGFIEADYTLDYFNQNSKIRVTIKTTTGEHTAIEGDWVVKGINGQFYAMPNDTFWELYEPEDKETEEYVIRW